MLKIVHAADLHAGRPSSRELDKEKASIRRREVETSLHTIIDLVKQEEANILLIAGDLFEHLYTRPSWVKEAALLFASIPKTRVFISPGNHDPALRDSLYRSIRWPENVTVFTEPEFGEAVLEDMGVAIYGYGWTGFSERERVVRRFRCPRQDLFSILLIHGDLLAGNEISAGQEEATGKGDYGVLAGKVDSPVENPRQSSEYLPILLEDLRKTQVDYVALGHIHAPMDFQVGKTRVVYPGCPEPLDFGDRGRRGVYLITVECSSNGGRGSPRRSKAEFIPIAKRKMRVAEVDITGLETYEQVKKAVLSLGDAGERAQDLWAVTLKGRIDPELELDLSALEREISPEFFFVKLIPDYVPDYDLEALKDPGNQSLEARFVRHLLDMKAQAVRVGDERGARVAELAMYYGLDALRHGEVLLRRSRSD